MRDRTFDELTSITQEIEKTDNLLTQLKSLDGIDSTTIWQYEQKKNNLYEELLTEMVNRKLHFSDFKELYNKILSKVTQTENQKSVPTELKENLNKAAQFI